MKYEDMYCTGVWMVVVCPAVYPLALLIGAMYELITYGSCLGKQATR